METRWIGIVALIALGCGGATGDDAGPRDGGSSDAGASDASAPVDASASDAGAPFDAGASGDAGTPSSPSGCDPLPAPAGTLIEVDPSMSEQLAAIVRDAPANATIVLADGTYRSTASSESERRLIFRNAGVTLRSASGNAAQVILDGEHLTEEIAYVVASDVTIAELTIRGAENHLVHVTSEDAAPVTGVRLYGVRFVDAGEQFVKVNPGGADGWVDDGLLACSTFELTDAGRPLVERASGGCYTGGIDAHAARGWVVRDNRFTGIYCAGEGLAEHAIHFWRSSRDTVVENNTIIDCARGVGFGLDDTSVRRTYPDDPYPGITPIQHVDGIIRNNVVWAAIPYYDTGVELAYARGVEVLHNTVVHAPSATGAFSSIDSRFDTTVATIANNLTTRITDRGGAATLTTNLTDTPLSYLVAPASGDFHLTADAVLAIGQGTPVPGAGRDLDGEPRDALTPDIGADER